MANEITDMKFIQAFNNIVLDYYLYAFKTMDIDHDRTLRDDYNRVMALLKDEFIFEIERNSKKIIDVTDGEVKVKQRILKQNSTSYSTNPLMPLYFAASRANQKEGVNPLLDILFSPSGKSHAISLGDNKQGLEYLKNMGYIYEKNSAPENHISLKQFASGYEQKIMSFLQFFSIYSFFETIPNYLIERLDVEVENPFLVKDRYIFPIMNEYIHIDLLKAKYFNKSVVLVCKNHISDHCQLHKVFPLQIRNSMNSARQYLIGIEIHPEDERKNSLISIRIDQIEKIIPIHYIVSKEDQSLGKQLLPYVWETSVRNKMTFDLLRRKGISNVKMQLEKMVELNLMNKTVLYLRKDEALAQYLQMYLNHHHQLSCSIVDDQYKVVIYHMDYVELRPFIRTLYPYLIRIEESYDPYYQNDLKAMIRAIEVEKGKKVIPIKEKEKMKIEKEVEAHLDHHFYEMTFYTRLENKYANKIVPLMIRYDEKKVAKLIYYTGERIQSVPIHHIKEYKITNEWCDETEYLKMINLVNQCFGCNISTPVKYFKQNMHEFEVHLKYKAGKKELDNPDLNFIHTNYPDIQIIEEKGNKNIQAHYFKVKVIDRNEIDHLLLQLGSIDTVLVDGKEEYHKKDNRIKPFEDHLMVFNCFMNPAFYTPTYPYNQKIYDLPLSIVEVQWLKDSLNDSHSRFFFNEEEINILQLRLQLGHSLLDKLVPVINTHQPKKWMIERFKEVYQCYLNHDTIEGYEVIKMEYYQKKDDFNIRMQKDHRQYCCLLSALRLDHLDECLIEYTKKEASIVIVFIDQKNLLDRLCNEFALYKKEVSVIETNKYKMTIYFDESDQNEIVRRLISYGPYIHSHDHEESLIEEIIKEVDFREINIEKRKEEVRE